jgi:hypothetical protein
MLTEAEFDGRFGNLPGELLDIYCELRSIIARIAPGVTETVHSRGTSYYYAERGGPVAAGVCQGVGRDDHIQLGFVHGAFLPDPHHLLEGDGLAMRRIPIFHYDSAPWDAISELINWSRRFDTRTQSFVDLTLSVDDAL